MHLPKSKRRSLAAIGYCAAGAHARAPAVGGDGKPQGLPSAPASVPVSQSEDRDPMREQLSPDLRRGDES